MYIVVLSMNRSFLQRVQHVCVCIELALHVFQSLIMLEVTICCFGSKVGNVWLRIKLAIVMSQC